MSSNDRKGAGKNWPRRILLMVVLFAFITRLYNLQYPANYYFDEVYHAMTAKLVARNDPRAFEWTHGDTIEPSTYVEWLHPPLAKYAQATTILLAGENAVGWRLSSVLFGVGVVLLTALLAHRLFCNRWLSVVAAGLVALDGLLLTQSRIAMNDIHVVFGFLMSLYVYVWYRQNPRFWRLVLVGCAIGLTLATKWSGAFVWASILLFELVAVGWSLVHIWLNEHPGWKRWLIMVIKQLGIRLLALIIIPLALYVASYVQMYSHGKDVLYFVELHKQIFYYQFNLEATHPYQSRPEEWVADLRPVWYFVEYLPNEKRADIYNTGNPFIFIGGLAGAVASMTAILVSCYRWLRQPDRGMSRTRSAPLSGYPLALSPMKVPPNTIFALSVLVVTYLLCWVPWLFSPRIMFFYHYAPAVPLLAIMIAYWWWFVYQRGKTAIRTLLLQFLFLAIGFFIVWYPHWVGIPFASTFKDTVYFALPSWR